MAKFEFNVWIFKWLLEQSEFKFEWDDGNKTKSLLKHAIKCNEAESVFIYNPDLIRVLGIQVSPSYESDEPRYGIFGESSTNKKVFICFTLKENDKIRIISIREINKKEREIYERLCKE